jgi:hypothetical protein
MDKLYSEIKFLHNGKPTNPSLEQLKLMAEKIESYLGFQVYTFELNKVIVNKSKCSNVSLYTEEDNRYDAFQLSKFTRMMNDKMIKQLKKHTIVALI